MEIIILNRLNTALSEVRVELENAGFYDSSLSEVEVFLVPWGTAHGWQFYRDTGEIHIPSVSLSRLQDLWNGNYTSLRDILRHEYAHAVADTHRGLIRSRQFREAFGAAHDSKIEWEFDPLFHVTEYAASCPMEDFAETFMCFLRHRGRLPASIKTPAIQGKWSFVRKLGSAIHAGSKKWDESRP